MQFASLFEHPSMRHHREKGDTFVRRFECRPKPVSRAPPRLGLRQQSGVNLATPGLTNLGAVMSEARPDHLSRSRDMQTNRECLFEDICCLIADETWAFTRDVSSVTGLLRPAVRRESREIPTTALLTQTAGQEKLLQRHCAPSEGLQHSSLDAKNRLCCSGCCHMGGGEVMCGPTWGVWTDGLRALSC